jgi:hypothetical protein
VIEIGLKNCKLCCYYNQKANATDKESLILGFHRLRDEALSKVLQHLSEYYEHWIDVVDKEQKKKKRIEKVGSLRKLALALDLQDVCLKCDLNSPKLVAQWDGYITESRKQKKPDGLCDEEVL